MAVGVHRSLCVPRKDYLAIVRGPGLPPSRIVVAASPGQIAAPGAGPAGRRFGFKKTLHSFFRGRIELFFLCQDNLL